MMASPPHLTASKSSFIFNHMVEYNQQEDLDRVFHALSDATRRKILKRLKNGPEQVTSLAKHYSISLNGVSKHLKALEAAQLIRREVLGRSHYCHLNAIRMKRAQKWIDEYREFWTTRLDALEKHLQEKQKKLKGTSREQ